MSAGANEHIHDTIWDLFGGRAFLGIDDEETNAESPSPALEKFSRHELPKVHPDALQQDTGQHDWFFPVILLLLFLLAWLRAMHQRGIQFLIKAFITNKPLAQSMLDENMLMKRASLFLNFLFAIGFSLFLYQVFEYMEWSYPGKITGIAGYFQILTVVTLTYIVKTILLKTIGEIFEVRQGTADYIFNNLLWIKVLGVVLIPIVILLAYLPFPWQRTLIFTGLFLFGAAFSLRLLRGYQVGKTLSAFSKFHLILYLCTLEILPLIVAIKLLVLYN